MEQDKLPTLSEIRQDLQPLQTRINLLQERRLRITDKVLREQQNSGNLVSQTASSIDAMRTLVRKGKWIQAHQQLDQKYKTEFERLVTEAQPLIDLENRALMNQALSFDQELTERRKLLKELRLQNIFNESIFTVQDEIVQQIEATKETNPDLKRGFELLTSEKVAQEVTQQETRPSTQSELQQPAPSIVETNFSGQLIINSSKQEAALDNISTSQIEAAVSDSSEDEKAESKVVIEQQEDGYYFLGKKIPFTDEELQLIEMLSANVPILSREISRQIRGIENPREAGIKDLVNSVRQKLNEYIKQPNFDPIVGKRGPQATYTLRDLTIKEKNTSPDPEPELENLEPPQIQKEAESETEPADNPLLVFDFTLEEPELKYDGKIFHLTNTEFNLLLELAENHTQKVKLLALKKSIWDHPFPNNQKVIEQLKQLADKLKQITDKDNLIQIETVVQTTSITLQNCEIDFLEAEEEEEKLQDQPSLLLESKPPIFSLEEGFYTINGRQLVLNRQDSQILSTLLQHPGIEISPTSLNIQVFGPAPMRMHDFHNALTSLKSSLRRVSGQDILLIPKGNRRTISLRNFVYEPAQLTELSTPRTPATPAIEVKETREPINELLINQRETPILSAILRKYNGQQFKLKNGQQITFTVQDEVLHLCDGLGKSASTEIITQLTKQTSEYLRIRKNLFRKLHQLLSSPTVDRDLEQYEENIQTVLEYIYSTEHIREILSQLGNIPRSIVHAAEKELIEKPWLGVPELNLNDLSELREQNDQQQVTEIDLLDQSEGSIPIGQPIYSRGHVLTNYAAWNNSDLLRFVRRELSASDRRSTRLIEEIGKMIRYLQHNPEDPRTSLADKSFRRLTPNIIPGGNLGLKEAAEIRLLYRVHQIDENKIINLLRLATSHKDYERYLRRGL